MADLRNESGTEQPINIEELNDYSGPLFPGLRSLDMSRLLTAASLRGVATIAIGIFLLVAPNRTPRLFAAAIALVLGAWAIGFLLEGRATGDVGLSRLTRAALLIGLGAALAFWPAISFEVLTTVAGLALLAMAGRSLVRIFTSTSENPLALVVGAALVRATVGVGLLVTPARLFVLAFWLAGLYWLFTGVVSLAVNLGATTSDGAESQQVWTRLLAWVQGRQNTADDREELFSTLFYEGPRAGRRLSRFFVLMALATTIAAFGIIADSTAVVIGAMLVAPLMTPLMATSLSLVMGWPRRVLMSGSVAAGGILVAIGLAAVFGLMSNMSVSPTLNAQVATRIGPTLVDLMIAIAAGGAGAFALSRRDVSDSLPGVAVAIALVPPLAVVGLMLSQANWSAAAGALLLFVTNAVAILLFGALVFVLTGVVPLLQLAQNARWIRTGVSLVGALGIAVLVMLSLSTDHFRAELFDERTTEIEVNAWLDRTPLKLVLIAVSPDTVDITLIGPEEPPPVVSLQNALEEVLGRSVTLTVDWIPQTTYVADAID